MKSMLVIESVVLAKLFAEVFGKLGWRTASCDDCECAMKEVAGSEHYDLILLSYCISGTDGIQLIKFIRSFDHRKRTAIVLMTSDLEIIEEAKEAGADEVLVKPVNVSSLIYAANKHVQ